MARLAWMALIALPLWGSCASTSGSTRFLEANQLMAEEIRSRVAQIPYQHREELFHNLLWLAQAGEQAIPALLDGLEHNNPKLRANAAWALGQIGDRRVIGDLEVLVTDEDQTVRLEVSRTLVVLGDIAHCAALIDALDSDKTEVRYLCHEALKSSTGQDFGYDHLSDDAKQRATTVLAWRKWWGQTSGDPWFAAGYATEHGLVDHPAEPDATPASPMVEVQRVAPAHEGPVGQPRPGSVEEATLPTSTSGSSNARGEIGTEKSASTGN